jgi:hypothetical protein
MSLRNAALMGLAVFGSAIAAAAATVSGPANAATTACGNVCISLMPERYGVADFLAVGPGLISMRGSDGSVGQPVILAAAGQVASEDWQAELLGTAAQLAADGVVPQVVGKTWPAAPSYEYQYTPDGRQSGLCLGVAGTAGLGTPATLQVCGVSSVTVWVKISRNLDRYGLLVSGTDTRAIFPYVLTAGSPGGQLHTSLLAIASSRMPSPYQMWATWFGPY